MLYDADEEDVESALETISVLQDVDVTFSIPSSGACNTSVINVIQVCTRNGFSGLAVYLSLDAINVAQIARVHCSGGKGVHYIRWHHIPSYFLHDLRVLGRAHDRVSHSL